MYSVFIVTNPEIDITGILMTRVDGRNTSLNETVRQQLEAAYGEVLLPVQIGINNSLSQAQHNGLDIYEYAPNCRGAEQYEDLAGHVAARLRGE